MHSRQASRAMYQHTSTGDKRYSANLHGNDLSWTAALLHGSIDSSSGLDCLVVSCILQGSCVGVLPEPPDSTALQLGPRSFFCCCLANGRDGCACSGKKEE